VPFIYYGDEIGLDAPADLPSKEGGFHRTAARTPMPWHRGLNAGFSQASAKALYLPVDSSPDALNVEKAEADPSSPLHTVRRLIALRKTHSALSATGEYRTVLGETGRFPYVYERRRDDQRFLVALNPAGVECSARLPGFENATAANVVAGEHNAFAKDEHGWHVRLPAVSYAIAQMI
jgi:maltose alpha-D-glucosyltransferase/alpha-amylase